MILLDLFFAIVVEQFPASESPIKVVLCTYLELKTDLSSESSKSHWFWIATAQAKKFL